MTSPRSKYSPEIRKQTAEFVLSSGRSATSVAEEMGIDVNTVCRWVRDYRRKNEMPSHAEEKGYIPKNPVSTQELKLKQRELERELKRKEKLLREEREKVEILKKSLHIFMQPHG